MAGHGDVSNFASVESLIRFAFSDLDDFDLTFVSNNGEGISAAMAAIGLLSKEYFTFSVGAIGGGGASSSEKIVVAKSSGQKLHLFLKICRKNSVGSHYNDLFHTFDRELDFYGRLYPAMLQLQKAFTRQPKLRLENFIPTFYARGIVDGDLYLILEDFVTEGFRVTHKESFITCDEIKSCLRAIGVFHAMSFASQFFDQFKWIIDDRKSLVDFITVDDSEEARRTLKMFFEDNINRNISFMTAIIREKAKGNEKVSEIRIPKEVDETLLERLANRPFLHFFRKAREPATDKNTNVLCHGDFHMWNVAFKDDASEENKLKVFDFQAVIYCSLACDLHQFLSQTSTPKMRESILSECLNAYSESFRDTCTAFPGIDSAIVEATGSLDSVIQDYKERSIVGFIFAGSFILRRFVNDNDVFQSLENKTDSAEIVDLLSKCVVNMQYVFQIYFDLFAEHVLLGTFDAICEKE
jgi:hypothetical protein